MAVSINPKGSAFAKEIKLGAARGEAISRKSAIPALNMGSDELVTDFAQVQFSELVMDESVLGNLVSRARRVPFNTRIVVQTDGSVGYWTGEGDAIGLSQIALYSTAITPLHVASILVASDEFVRHASADAENVLRRDLARGLALQIDQTLLDPTNAGSEVKPAAITYGLSAEDTFADMMTEGFTGDLTKAVWVARPETWMGIQTHPSEPRTSRRRVPRCTGFRFPYAPENSLILWIQPASPWPLANLNTRSVVSVALRWWTSQRSTATEAQSRRPTILWRQLWCRSIRQMRWPSN